MHSQSPKIIECSSNGDRQTVAHSNNGILYEKKKQQTLIKIKLKKT